MFKDNGGKIDGNEKRRKRIKENGLHKIRQGDNESVIIFVHGLQGDPFKTWTKKGYKSMLDLFEEDDAFKQFDLFTFGYRTGFLLKRHHFQDISKLLYTELKTRITHKKIYFVTHSMGGVIVQSLLTEQVEKANSEFNNRIRGIVYLAVPFAGSSIASVASAAYAILPPLIGEHLVSLQVRSLSVFSKELANVAGKWVRYTGEQLSHVNQKNIYGLSDWTVGGVSPNPPYIFDSDSVEENHRSICKVENRESTVYILIKQFFDKMKHEYGLVVSNEASLDEYLKWLKNRTNTFIVPGVQVPLPIEEVWAGLHVIEELTDSSNESLESALIRYHEWERLARKVNKRNAQDVTELGKRIVLIGGPGSGKSTLARRTVNRLANRKKKTLFVRLPSVVKDMTLGRTFEDAIWSVALDGYVGNKTLIRTLMEVPDVLVADGLDECGASQRDISAALQDWVLGRSETRVIITTRPIGYEPAQYSQYQHVEILPLEDKEIDQYSFNLIRILVNDKQRLSQELHSELKQNFESNRTANIAARSPLLLNFIVQLLISGKPFGRNRAELYGKIIEEWMRTSNRGELLGIQPQTAIRALEIVGWIIQNSNGKGNSEQDMLNIMSSALEQELRVPRLVAREHASSSIKYWTEKGLLEQLRIGYEDAITFIHLTLGEYVTARYISGMSEDSRKRLFLKTYRIPSWRETWLLTGGLGSARLIVETLLELVPEYNDVYNDMVLAAAVLAETVQLPDLSKMVAERLIEMICSRIPVLAYEAGEALEGIAHQEPQWILSLTEKLLNHEQEWSKMIATKLSLVAGKHIFDVKGMLMWISTPPKDNSKKLVWNEIIVLGVSQIIEKGATSCEELEPIAEILSEGKVSMRTIRQITVIFSKSDYTNLSYILNRKWGEVLQKFDFEHINDSIKSSEHALFRIALNILSSKNEKHSKPFLIEAYTEMSKLYHGLDIGNNSFDDLYVLAKGFKLEVVETVLRGMISVLQIDENTLAEEIYVALEASKLDTLLRALPDIPTVDSNWSCVPSLELNHVLLVEALGYPSDVIARCAANLLLAGAGRELAKDSIIEILNRGNSQMYYYFSQIAHSLFDGEKTKEIVIEHLEGEHKEGLEYLYELLISVPNVYDDERVHKVLIRGIEDRQPLKVKRAAMTLMKLGRSIGKDSLWEAIKYWDKNGVLCETHGIVVLGACCPKCKVVPPSPLPDLLYAASKLHNISIEQWYYFALHQRHDVRDAGLSGLSYLLSQDKKLLSNTVTEILGEKISSKLIAAVFNTDVKMLIQIKEELLLLYTSESVDVRKKLVQELGKCIWVSKEEAEELLIRALKDDEAAIRSNAVVSLRAIRSYNPSKMESP